MGGDANPLPWRATRVFLGEKFGVLPTKIDELSFQEVLDALSTFDGQGKADTLHTDRR